MEKTGIIKTAGVGVVVLAAVLGSSLTAKSMEDKTRGGNGNEKTSSASKEEKPVVDPITDEIKSIAEAYEYDFNPGEVHFNKEDLTDGDGNFDFSSAAGISNLPTNGQRSDYHLIYKFEGSYAEGWQGDYSKTYAYLYLWEDGKFAGTSGSTQFRGYWYDNGGSELVMVTSNNADGAIIAYEQTGFYTWIVDLDSSVNQGRRIKAFGYLYYPEVAVFITPDEDFNAANVKVGDTVDISGWVAQRVLKNLNYSSCYETNNAKVAWKVNGANVPSSNIIACNDAGDYEVTATWGSGANALVGSITFTVA